MRPPRTVLSARHLGSGRYRLTVDEPATAGPLSTPRNIRVQPCGDSPPARLETIAPPTPSAPRRWSLVITVDDGDLRTAPARYRLTTDDPSGWQAEIRLGSGLPEEPGSGAPVSPLRPVNPNVDYTARDFDGLRSLILTTLTQRVGSTVPPLTVDEIMAVIEEMAYLGDALSYYQDAIATEAYLSTARRRISVTRHAALMNYYIGQGRSARTWIRVQPADGTSGAFTLPAGTKLLTALDTVPPCVGSAQLAQALAAQPLVFETVSDVAVTPLPPLELDSTAHPGQRLEAAAVSATVLAPQVPVSPGELLLLAGDGDPARLVTIADVAGTVIRVQQAGPARAGRVTLTWSADDAPGQPGLPAGPGAMCLLRGNLVIADHGCTQPWRELPGPSAGLTYWPLLPAAGTTFAVASPPDDGTLSAAALVAAAAGQPMPAVSVCEMGAEVREWTVRSSLLDSGPVALDFVVETEDDGSARLRFGDNTNGMQPGVGAELRVRQRTGGGTAGNVAAGSLRHVATEDPRVAGIVQPSDACGGADPEPVASARQQAPEQFRVNQRAILPSDYENLAMALFPGQVTDAAAELAGDGAAPAVTLYIHTGSWPGAGDGLRRDVRDALRRCQPLGMDLRVPGAVPCPVDIELEVTLEPGVPVAIVGQQVDNAIQAGLLTPGRFGFGVPLYRSEVVAMVATVPGVADVTCLRFAFTGEERRLREVLAPARGQVLRLDNDRTAPGNGQVTYRLKGVR